MKISKPDISFPFTIPSSSKIIDCEIHPVHSWALIIEEDRSVYLWDYSLQSILVALSHKDLDDRENGGTLRSVKFLDPHVLRWKWLRSQDLSAEAFQGKGKEKSWFIVVMEYRLLFFNYRTGDKRYLYYNVFENKGITCVEIVDSSYLAVGFSDGSIRLFDLEDWEVVKLFPRGTHSKSITHLISYSKNLSQRSLLISASGEGIIAVWNVDTCTDIPAFLIQSGSSSAHNGQINSISLNIETAQLFVVGSDSCLSVWNISNSTLVHKYKNLKIVKKKIAGGCYFNHPVMTQSTVLVHSGTNILYYFDTLMYLFQKDSQVINTLIELPQSKLISIKAHPLQPYLIFAICEESVFPIYYERSLPQAFAYSDLLTSSIKPSAGCSESHFMYYYARDTLYSLIFSIPSEMAMQACQLQTRPIGSKVQMKVSPSGKYMSVLSAMTGLFDIYEIDLNPAKTPDRLKSGYSTHLVWDYSTDRFACICPLNEDDTTGSFVGFFKILLVVYEINNGKVCLIYRGDSMAKPNILFGGRALGVAEDQDLVTFYSWESLKPVSSGIPKPSEVYWTENACVIAYKQVFFVYIYKERLEFAYKISHSIRTGLWSYSVFFYTTDSELFWLVPCIQESFLLASHSVDNEEENEFNIKEDKINGKVCRKPHEYCTVVGIFQGFLIILTNGFRLVNIQIRSVFLKFCLLVTCGHVELAMNLTGKMQDNLHGPCAKVLRFMDFPEHALELSGISYWKALKIAVERRIKIELKGEIFRDQEKLKKMVLKNKDKIEFLSDVYQLALDLEKHEICMLVAVCLKNSEYINKALEKSGLTGRLEIRKRKI